MLQVDHIYEFLYQTLFNDFDNWFPNNGVVKTNNVDISDTTLFTQGPHTTKKIFFYDQEPFIPQLATPYLEIFNSPKWQANKNKMQAVLATSEYSNDVNENVLKYNYFNLYYFYHGFAALDWYRGYYALNYNKQILKHYNYDFITFNRIINNDRSYRIYFVSLLKEQGLLDHGLISFNVTDNAFDGWQDETADLNSKLSEQAKQHIEKHMVDIDQLVIDNSKVHGSASACIPRTINRQDVNNDTLNVDAFWHIVTETVFYYDKLHLTEKIFKPIVSKQPFMLLAAPGNLAYLRSYGFKTFDGIIDESYDTITDPDLRTEAVVKQLAWYCALSDKEKQDVIYALEPIIEHNFHHFYGDFRHIIVKELLDNIKSLFQKLEYDDRHINYNQIHHVLVNN
jgi:hypothetical protein